MNWEFIAAIAVNIFLGGAAFASIKADVRWLRDTVSTHHERITYIERKHDERP
jgi:hypothetical protein